MLLLEQHWLCTGQLGVAGRLALCVQGRHPTHPPETSGDYS